ncbi:D-tyrosyl-tRNA(Tyr) deacylase [bacterium]|jgi:D-tyrosyl-tRNA(Tyr) deacylase|nr:D-tyrosyl-tRNA(Tyr) deacylase [bacterium]MDP6571839.1 D-aminoacyl-tRNA deacylase [Patescibacteria group bacterium]|tara:strand:- start:5202 stop:5648 length:447 start_codon:yes stop_codon:yes gene_type:complete
MKAILQRVTSSSVVVDGNTIGKIERGLNILLGITHADNEDITKSFVEKIVNLRIFQDEQGKMNKSILDIKGEILLISQFTLYGDTTKGRRPSFVKAADPEKAKQIYDLAIELFSGYGLKVQTGEFGGYMDVEIHNDGPTTIILDSNEI